MNVADYTSKQMEVTVRKCASIFLLHFAIFLFNMPSIICLAITQGGNDYEIFESDKTIGHTGKSDFFYVWSCIRYVFITG